MNLLYIDTICEWMVLGLYSLEGGLVQELNRFQEKVEREGGIRLSGEIQKLLKDSGVKSPDLITVLHGPGSFTGIRIGLSFVRAYSQGLRIPCLGINTLEVYSHYYYHKHSKRSIVLLDGRMKKVYAGVTSSLGFEKAVDLSLEMALQEMGTTNSLLISDFKNSDMLDISLDFPHPIYFLQKQYSTLKNLNFANHNYNTLNPNYMRGTYVDGKT